MSLGGRIRSFAATFECAVGLWGDLPYSATQEAALPNVIADMNDAQLAFTVHDGDLKQGSSSPCDDALYQRALGWFSSLEGAAMFTPGDNDWTDCDRASNGGFNSLERLNHERALFFSTSYSLGQHPLVQEVQAAPYVENRRWTVKGVTYATLNVQGSCNNLCDTAPDPAEYAARNAADIAWLQQTFADAKADGSAAVMLIGQADPGFDASDATRGPVRDPTLVETDGQPDGYRDFLAALRSLTIDVRRSAQPRRLRVPAADRPGEPGRGPRAVAFRLR